VRLFGDPVATGFSYYVVARTEACHVAAFTDWIIEEAAQDIDHNNQIAWD